MCEGKTSLPSDVTEFDFPCACGATIPHVHCEECGGVIDKPTGKAWEEYVAGLQGQAEDALFAMKS